MRRQKNIGAVNHPCGRGQPLRIFFPDRIYRAASRWSRACSAVSRVENVHGWSMKSLLFPTVGSGRLIAWGQARLAIHVYTRS